MAYALVQDVASTWEQYEQIGTTLSRAAPAGLILHVAGPTDEGYRMISVWESEKSWRDFHDERLAPAMAALGGPARPEPTFRELRPAHIVAGALIPVVSGPGGSVEQTLRKEER